MKAVTAATALLASVVGAQNATFTSPGNNPLGVHLRTDNGTYGPTVEVAHYYYDQWPIGLAVSSTGRIFTCYTRGNYQYTVGEVVNMTTERAFPSSGGNSTLKNLGPNELNTTFNGIPFGVSNPNLISVQALAITSAVGDYPELLWIVDTGSPGSNYTQPGGPKIIAMNITNHNDTVYRSYTFPANVHYPDSYLNDIRVDLRSNLSDSSGKGIAYLVDSSNQGRPGFIMLDLGTGESWRRLSEDPSVLRTPEDVPSYVGKPFYLRIKGSPVGYQLEGNDGIQLSADGETVYYSPLTSNYLYSVPSANLRVRDTDPLADLMAHSNVSSHGQRGANANGFEGDNQGRIYQLMPTQNAIYYYDPSDLQTHPFVRDPRILWADSANVGADGYIYFNINQLFFQPMWNNGVDLRIKPGAILRAKLPNGAGKIVLG